MDNKLYIVISKENRNKLSDIIFEILEKTEKKIDTVYIDDVSKASDMKDKKILFINSLNAIGNDDFILSFLLKASKYDDCFSGSVGSLITLSDSDLYTKSFSSNLVFQANKMGCAFIGHPMVEATKEFKNFKTWQKTYQIPLRKIFILHSSRLILRLLEDNFQKKENPHICVLHASSKATSNTLSLWHMVEESLSGCTTKELHVENGTLTDCIGCSYDTCMYFSKRKSCFYGGFVIKEIFPEVEKADSILWLCPNYNDSISANLTAVINRLTALYRNISFYDKNIFSIIISGNSGSDSLAKQLIDALNINKGFRLPPRFSLMETAYDPKSIYRVENIKKISRAYADHIVEHLKL